jgi:hypothetical protein
MSGSYWIEPVGERAFDEDVCLIMILRRPFASQ